MKLHLLILYTGVLFIACNTTQPISTSTTSTPGQPATTPASPATPATTSSGTTEPTAQVKHPMLEEINLLRANPPAYIPLVESYLVAVANDDAFDAAYKKAEKEAGQELIAVLRQTPVLSQVEYQQGLYQAATQQGEDLKKINRISHTGRDGSQPFDRIKKYAAEMVDGSENIVSGATSVREALMILLVDSGIPGRGHRVNLLNPKWNYAACYEAGVVDGIPGTWVQVFAANNAKPETATAPLEEGPADYSFMTADERTMIEEINLMRGNPKGYIPYVQAYLEEFRQAGWDSATVSDEVATADELIAQLRKMEPLSILRPHKQLYEVAKVAGADLRQMGRITHTGSDGSQPYNRIIQGTNLSDGNENIVGGIATTREAVITLLVDSGIPNRGHRTTLLEPKWDYAACYRIGQVGDMPATWLQLFGAR